MSRVLRSSLVLVDFLFGGAWLATGASALATKVAATGHHTSAP